ncbi:MAG: zinc ribbon domain-containing protein [Pseudomonadota bacterium]
MPIYEFRCLNCQDLFEMLVMNSDEHGTVKCPRCNSETSERVMSTTNFCMTGSGGNASSGPSAQTRNCSGGSCTTYDIPGPK